MNKQDNSKIVLGLYFCASIPYAIWVLYFTFDFSIKVFSSIFIWIACILILKNRIQMYNPIYYTNKNINKLVFLLLSITIIQIMRYMGSENFFSPSTVFTHPYFLLCLCTPILYYSYTQPLCLNYIYKYSLALIIISSIFIQSNYYLLYLSPILCYKILVNKHSNKKLIFICLISLLLTLKDGIIPNPATGDTQRALLIILAYAGVAFFLCKFSKLRKKIASFIAITSIITPVILLSFSLYTKTSIFSYSNEIKNEQLQGDTRSFLYEELLTDLNKKDAFILGIGIGNGYYSPYFRTHNRDTSEVHFLQILSKGGIIWLITYMGIIISAIFHALKNSNNYLCIGGSIMLSGFFLSGFIIDSTGFNFIHILIWFYIYICSSKRWNNLSDKKIYQLLHNRPQ